MLSCFLFCAAALNAGTQSWQSFTHETIQYQQTIPGWCSPEKAQKMMDLIYDTYPSICVEIGVFGGSSVYPTARALNYLKNGMLYAIDPWKAVDCRVGYAPDDPNAIWWSQVNLDKIFKDFRKMIQQNHLSKRCTIMRTTSQAALTYFMDDSIDILHIDGNHSEVASLADVEMFFPKVKSGGYIWFDDVDWSTTHKAVLYLYERCTVDPIRSIEGRCVLFKKP